jgi:hypothetical protein
MIVYFELICIREDKTDHKICNIQIKHGDVPLKKGEPYKIDILNDISGYDYDFGIWVDLDNHETSNNRHLRSKIEEVRKIINRKYKLEKINGKTQIHKG